MDSIDTLSSSLVSGFYIATTTTNYQEFLQTTSKENRPLFCVLWIMISSVHNKTVGPNRAFQLKSIAGRTPVCQVEGGLHGAKIRGVL